MNLFEGLEKFGIKSEETDNLFAEEKKTADADGGGAKKESAPTEESLLLEKAVRCAVCDQVFKTKMVKSGRIKRLEPDLDLRPRFQYIDTLKYDVTSCPFCGYTAMNRYFEHLSSAQMKLIRETVCANFQTAIADEPEVYDYDTAIGRYKLALFNTVAKKGKTSEKAYACLKIAWLYRGKGETLPADATEKERADCKTQEEAFYNQAYEGFVKAVSTENFPMCGMDQTTVDYLLAVMAQHFKRYDMASKCISRIMGSTTASKKMKDKAYELKEKILQEMKNAKS